MSSFFARRRHVCRRASLVGVLAVSFAQHAYGQDASDRKVTTMPSVTVTSDRMPPEASRLNETAPAVHVARPEFETLPNDRVSDIVGRMPGMVLGGPPGEKKSLNFRGLPGDFTRVELDGVQLPSSGQTRAFELMNLPSFVVQDVTILRLPTAEYEADGLAGRVAIKTRMIPDTPSGEAQFAAGGIDAIDGGNLRGGIAYGGRASKHFGAFGAFNVDRRDVIKLKDFSERTFTGGPGGQGFLRDEDEPKSFVNTDLLFDFAGFYGDGEIHIKPLLLDEKTVLDKRRDQFRRVTGQMVDRTLSEADEDTRTTGLTADWTHRPFDGGVIAVLTGVARTSFDSENAETVLNPNLTFNSGSSEDSKIADRLVHGTAKLTAVMGEGREHEMKVGATVRNNARRSDRDVFTLNAQGQRSQNADNRSDSVGSDYWINETLVAGFVQDRIAVGDRFTAIPGLRFETVHIDLEGGNGVERTREFSNFLPSLPVAYRVTDEFTVRAAVARLVNRPKFDEIAPGVTRRGQRRFNGNPDLKAAEAWGFEAGMDFAVPYLFLGANYFTRDIQNLIEAREVTTNNYVFENVGNGSLSGLEFEQRIGLGILGEALGWRGLTPLSLIANETLIDATVKDPATGKRPFADQPRFVANFGLQWADDDTGLLVAAMANYTSSRRTVSYEAAGQIRDKTRDDEFNLDIRVEQRVVPGMSVFFTAENLTNQDRDEIELVNDRLDRVASIATGRVFYVGLKGRF